MLLVFIVCYRIAKCIKGNNKGKYNVPLFNDWWFGLWPNKIVCTTLPIFLVSPCYPWTRDIESRLYLGCNITNSGCVIVQKKKRAHFFSNLILSASTTLFYAVPSCEETSLNHHLWSVLCTSVFNFHELLLYTCAMTLGYSLCSFFSLSISCNSAKGVCFGRLPYLFQGKILVCVEVWTLHALKEWKWSVNLTFEWNLR